MDPTSLHYRSADAMNSYQHAIHAVGQILQEYDSDKMFPVYGFGAKLPDGTITHAWPLNGNEIAPECVGVQGMLEAYKLALDNVALYVHLFVSNYVYCLGGVRRIFRQ